MPRFRIRLIDLMAVVAFAAIVFGLKTYLDHARFNASHIHEPALAIYLSVLSTSILGARFGHRRWRRFWLGVALFGGIYLAIGLKLAWNVGNYYDSEALLSGCQIALALGLLCGIAAQWLIPAETPDSAPPRPLTDDARP